MKESTMTNNDQGIVRDNRGEEQPADKERAQNATSVEEKKKRLRMKFRKPLRRAGSEVPCSDQCRALGCSTRPTIQV
jgi:hypothetical protein